MLNLSTLSRVELQGLAKEEGIKANLPSDKIIKMLLAVRDDVCVENQAVQEQAKPEEVDTAFSNVATIFETVVEEMHKPKEITSHNDLSFSGYVSEGIARYAFQLYQRHGLDVSILDGKDYRFIKGEVDRLNAMPFPPSPKQRETINNLVAELKQLNSSFDVPVQVLNSLTGGQEGTAGEFIAFLYRQRTEFEKNAPLSDAQADRLAEWFLCPDIPWDDYQVQVTKAYPTELNPNGWMFLTVDEFKAVLKERFTREQASAFIGLHKDKFYDWKRTRINDYQVDTIRKLEQRMGNISKLGVKEFAMVDGVVQEVYRKPQRDWNPEAYKPMDDFFLRQMSKDDASKYIRQLESEVSFRERSAIDDSKDQETLEQKRNKLSAPAKAVNNATTEYQNLINIVFALEAVACHTNEDLHESVTELMVHKRGNAAEVARDLYEFMDLLLEKHFISFNNLVNMCEESKIATQILEIKYPEQYEEAINGKKDPVKAQKEQEAKQQAVTAQANNTVADFMNQWK